MPESQTSENLLAISYGGTWFLLLAPLIGLLSLVICSLVVYRGRNQMAVATLILAANLPILCGVLVFCNDSIASAQTIYHSGTKPKANELAFEHAHSLGAIRLGLLAAVPGYSVALVGSLVRSFRSNADEMFDELSS